MMTVAPLASGQAGYYLGLAATAASYYADERGMEPAGNWYGPGAAEFGLRGIVTSEALNRLCEGVDPQDPSRRLVRNAQTSKRAHGTDLCMSAPKSVSIAWALASPELRMAIEARLMRAVRHALDYIQDACGGARVGAQGQRLERVPLMFALFEHSSSRNGDVQLHVHCICPNITTHADGRTTAIDPTSFYRHMMAAGALFRASFAAGLSELGFIIERDKSSFRISGISEEFCDRTSTRRAEIIAAILERSQHLGRLEGLEEAEILDATRGRMAEIINLETRRAKRELSRSDIFDATRRIADELGLPPDYIEGLLHPHEKPTPGEKARILEGLWRTGVEKISLQNSHWSERDLIRFLAEEGQDKGIDGPSVRELVANKLAGHELVRIGELVTARKDEKRRIWRDVSEQRYTTREILLLEGQMIEHCEMLDRRWAGVPPGNVDAAIEVTAERLAAEGKCLSTEQRRAIAGLTGDEAIACLHGMAGTSKSTVLGACRLAWELSGKTVLGIAIAGSAADSLSESSGIRSETLAMILGRLRHQKLRLTPEHVVALDEAGQVPTRMFAELVMHVHKSGAKLVAAGDQGQIQAIEAGGPFGSICRRISNVSSLTEIHRQRESWRKETVRQFSRGEAREALIEYAAHEQLHVAPTRDAALLKLVALWKRNGGHLSERARDNYIAAPLNSEVKAINRLCQAERLSSSQLGARFLTVGGEQIHENDRIVLTKKDRKMAVENGFRGVVASVDDEASRLTVRLDKDGREIVLSLSSYGHIKLGYASTVHLAQGSTREAVFVLLGGHMMDRHLTYVAASRSRGITHLVADNAEVGRDPALKDAIRTLSRSMSRDRTKDLAMDHLRPRAESPFGLELARGPGIPGSISP